MSESPFEQRAIATELLARSFQELGELIREHEEEWRCSLPGQWPDEFVLLNRYVRADTNAPYIFND